MTLRDGSIVQDGLRFTERKQNPGDTVRFIPYPVIGQVTKIIAPEDSENFDQETYLCDVHVTELGIDLFQVPWTLGKCGPDNYIHYGPVAATANVNYKPFIGAVLDPEISNGDSVLVCFAFGDVHKPYIIRVLPHNQSGPNGLSPDPRPTKDDGDCYKVRFNGTNLSIDKDGNMTIENTDTLDKTVPRQKVFTINWNNLGGQANKFTIDMSPGGELIELEHATGAFILMDTDGSIDMQSSFGDEVLISPTEGVQISTPSLGGTSASFKNGQIDFVAGQGISFTTNGSSHDIISDGGDINIQSTVGAISIEADGGPVDIQSTTGDVTVEASTGAIKLVAAGGAELNLAAGKVALGAAAAELLDLVSQAFTALSSQTAPGFGAPTSTVAQFGILATKILLIKGSL